MKAPATILLLSSAIFVYSNVIGAVQTSPKGILDGILIDFLNQTFQNLTNLTVPEVAVAVDQQGVNLSFAAIDLIIQNLENIEIEKLDTTLIPIRVRNITLKLGCANVTTDQYDLNALIVSGSLQGPVELFGHGKARIDLENIFLTASIDFTSVNTTLQIKEKGIKGFYISLGKSNVLFENLLNDTQLGEVANVFLSYFIPYLVADFSQTAFETYQEQIISILNDALKNVHFP